MSALGLVALVIGSSAALVVPRCCADAGARGEDRASVDSLLEIAGKVGGNTANIPQLEATAPVWG